MSGVEFREEKDPKEALASRKQNPIAECATVMALPSFSCPLLVVQHCIQNSSRQLRSKFPDDYLMESPILSKIKWMKEIHLKMKLQIQTSITVKKG